MNRSKGSQQGWREGWPERAFSSSSVLVACIVLDGVSLVVDLLLPAEYSTGILYIGATLLSFWLSSKRKIVGLAVLGTALLVLGYVVSPMSPGFGSVETIANRAFTALIIWLATAIALGHLEFRAALEASKANVNASEARFRSILETAPEALITIDEQGRIESFSRSSETLFGYEAEEVIGKNVNVLMPSPYREEHDDYLTRYLRTGEKRIIGIGRVVSARRKDGSIFPIELAVGEANFGGHKLFTGFIRDMSAKQRLEQELRQAQKMEAVGQLTGGIAHDFNNLLTVILGNLEMVESRISDQKLLELTREARETADHGAQLTGRLLAFGRRQPLQPKLTDVGHLLESLHGLLNRTLGEAIEIQARRGPRLSEVIVDPTQLQGAILNLALNARDAMPNGGKLTISAEDVVVDRDYARLHAEVRPGQYIVISVTDTGFGMDQETQERAFDPFFTTKEVGAGSGLGLSMVYGFVKQSNGHVQLYSEPGHGTTIRIYLPRADRKEADVASSTEVKANDFRSMGETVLVVEDEARVRWLTLMRLQEFGYRTLEAANGPAALDLLERDAGVDLVFTDVIMPGGMTGADLAKQVQMRWPHIPVLFTSGYAEPDLVRQGLSNGARWLKKPYTSLEFARSLRDILDTRIRRS